MRELGKRSARGLGTESASKRDLLKWILNIMDTQVKAEEFLMQRYRDMDDKAQADYFEYRLAWDRAARSFIAEDLQKCDDEE